MSGKATKLRGGVAGAGAFGAIHAGKYDAAARAVLAGVYDADFDRARAVADGHGAATAYDDFDAFLAGVDVVTIATPARAHGELSLRALEVGRHVLVEKPLATTHAEGVAAIAAAKGGGLTLAVGHQERLVFETMGLLAAPERPTLIEARREGPWSGRGDDVSVTLDLAIHDADLAMRLVGGAPVAVSARGARVKSRFFDTIESEARFADGAVVRLTASRVAEARRRTMRLVYPSGEVEIDFVARTLRNATSFALDAGFAETPIGKDPLGANVARFLDAVVGAAPRPAVTGEEALAALDLILAIDAAGS